MFRKKFLFMAAVSSLLCGCRDQVDFETYYRNACKRFEERVEIDKNCDIDFVGDSITERYNLEKYYPNYKVANRGISGDTTDMLLTRMEISSILLEPKVINLLIGTNNLNTCMNNYEYILQGFKNNLPNTKVVVNSILPRRGVEYYQKIINNNNKIKALAEAYGYTYVDLYPNFMKNGKLNEMLFADGLHLNSKGYQIMSDVLLPVFTDLLNS